MIQIDHPIKKSRVEDIDSIFKLYKRVSKNVGGLARNEDEITREYVRNFTEKSIKDGIQLIIADKNNDELVIAEIHCYRLDPSVFSHILSELTISVHPDYQGNNLGRFIFKALLDFVQDTRKDILRVELIARESNTKAIGLYESLGFVKEGRMERRIINNNRSFEADIPMAWFNPNFENISVIAAKL